jgi:ribose transport system permease protein
MTRALSTRSAITLAPLVLLIVLTIAFGLVDSRLVSTANLVNVVAQATPIALLALGAFVVLVTAGIDLTAAVAVSLCAILMASQLQAGAPLPVALGVGLASMLALGLFNGFMIAVLRIPPFVTTLATMVAVQGATLTFAERGVLTINEPALKAIGIARTFGIPNAIFVTAIIAGAAAFLMRRTRFGPHTFALGSDVAGAELAGVPIRRQLIIVYVTSSVFAFFTAVLMVSRVPVVTPNIGGTGLLLDAIAAAVIGGTSVSGGRGTVIGVLLGALIVSLLTNALRIFGTDPSSIDLFKGLMIMIALIGDRVFSILAVRRGNRRPQTIHS